jgi:tRNA (pseudouridine54-N1)-methyltransferase
MGGDGHPEIIAHTIASCFYLSQSVRLDTALYVVFDQTPNYPRSIRFCVGEGLSFAGFHEEAIFQVIVRGLTAARGVAKGEELQVLPGLSVFGFGFERVVERTLVGSSGYLLHPDGDDVRDAQLGDPAVFILSDHLALPKNSLKGLERQGIKKLSLGPKMLFASQAVTLLHNELDRRS